jgi:Flp pilus assembly pilin Flp
MKIELLTNFLSDEAGQSIVEYTLLMTLIAATSVVLLTMMGLSISRMFGMNDITVENYYRWAFDKFSTK